MKDDRLEIIDDRWGMGKVGKIMDRKEMEDFVWQTEQFGDIKILRYQVPVFEALSPDERIFIYYLSQAALAGRDILWDQNNRYNLKVRKALEWIIRDYAGDRETVEFQELMIYAKKVFFANGVHHHYSMDKFVPEFSREYFRQLLIAIGRPELFQGLERIIFDPCYMSKRVVLDEGVDLIEASANNYYAGVTQKEVEQFYKVADTNEKSPVSRGLNSTLI